jgi:hypothetical protein
MTSSQQPTMPDISDSERTPLVNTLLEIIAWQEVRIEQLEQTLLKRKDGKFTAIDKVINSEKSDHFIAGETPVYIFLDIDGVLVKEDKPGVEIDPDEDLQKLSTQCMEKFEALIRQYKSVKIVISSSWREIFSLDTIKSSFPKDIAEKIVGVTPIKENPVQHYRYQEILDYLQQEKLIGIRWVAIDDVVAHFPNTAPVIITDPFEGFNEETAQVLERFLTTGKYL